MSGCSEYVVCPSCAGRGFIPLADVLPLAERTRAVLDQIEAGMATPPPDVRPAADREQL